MLFHHLYFRDDWCLCYVNCGRTLYFYESGWAVGHILAYSKGGSNTIENLVPICISCNSSMRDTHMIEWMITNNRGNIKDRTSAFFILDNIIIPCIVISESDK